MGALEISLLYLLAAVSGVVICRSLRLPPMLGYLCVGVVIGPHALAVSNDEAMVHTLGELGVVLLMFVIGLEFNLSRLHAMRRHVFGLGLLQVVVTMLLGSGVMFTAGWLLPEHSQLGWRAGMALAATLAMSSTAIVVKLMSERTELESEHGQRVMGILLLQDLAVVPLLVLIPALGSPSESLLPTLSLALLKAAAIVGLLLVGGKQVMRVWLTVVAKRKSDELFMLNLLLVTLGLGWLTELAGLSMALGAFIAGMLISETQYKHRVEADIRPFHDILLGLFFISIGMLLDWQLVLTHWWLVLLLLLVFTVIKTALITLLARLTGASAGVALRTGLYLAQAGEFGFVLLSLAQQQRLLPQELLNPVLAAMVLSMLATPFIILYSNRIVLKLVSSEWLMQSLQMTQIARKSMSAREHIIICGFGRCGQNLGRILEQQSIPYIALDLDPDRVRVASAAGHSVVYGDSIRLQALMAAGLARASAVVITYLDEAAALKVLHHVQSHAPQVPAIVRTQDDVHLEKLQHAGATEVVPEAIEGSLMLASHALALIGVPMRRVIRIVQDQRDARYSLLRGFFHGADDAVEEDGNTQRLTSVQITSSARACGKRIGEIQWPVDGVHVVHIRSHSGAILAASPDQILQASDTLVLSGNAHALELAQSYLIAD